MKRPGFQIRRYNFWEIIRISDRFRAVQRRPCQFGLVKDATTNFNRFVGSASHYLLPLNFFWFLRWCIVGWTIVIVFFTHCLGLVYSCSSLCWIQQRDWFVALGDLIILHRFLLICTGYCTPSIFLTRSVSLCSSVWKAWLLPIFLICVGTAAVVGRSGLRSAARGDLVVPGHRTEWGSRPFAVAGPKFKCWNKLPVGLGDLSVGPETFARCLKTHLFRAGFFWLSTHFWVCIKFCRVRHNVRLIIITNGHGRFGSMVNMSLAQAPNLYCPPGKVGYPWSHQSHNRPDILIEHFEY